MTTLIDLSKKAQIVLEKKAIFGEKAQVIFAIDISGSMSSLYRNGTVQELVDRLLGIAMNLDDNKSIDVYAFGRGAYEVSSASEGNHANFVSSKLNMPLEGDTKYAGVMSKIVAKYGAKKTGFFKKTVATATIPTYVVFVTDGNNSDPKEAESVIRESSDQAIFWQFVGIGHASFNFLQKLDDLTGRTVDNADFFAVRDLRGISDEELYDKLLTEFPSWLQEVRQKGILEA